MVESNGAASRPEVSRDGTTAEAIRSVAVESVDGVPSAGRRREWRLVGDGAWWVFLTAEFLTLCLFFVVFAVMRRDDLEEFQTAQKLLEPHLALINSLVLITSGYAVARGVAAMRNAGLVAPAQVLGGTDSTLVDEAASQERALGTKGSSAGRQAAIWIFVAAALGLVFVAIKGGEYADKLGAGLTLSSGTFWFFYYFLTGFHFLHVLLGIGFLSWVGSRLVAEPHRPGLLTQAESCAAFWHMLDLVWILLFPLLYLL